MIRVRHPTQTMSTMASNESRSGSVRLVQFTDTHLLDDPDGILRGARTLPRLQACIAHAQRHFFPADAVASPATSSTTTPARTGSWNSCSARWASPCC